MSKVCKCCNNVITFQSERYPRIVCSQCSSLDNIIDSDGNKVYFENESIFGGFISVHDIDNMLVKKSDHICYINNIKCYADEARFGGIVIQTIDE